MPWLDSIEVQEATTRLKRFYHVDVECMERDIAWRVVRASFFVSGVVGGLSGRKEAERRLQVYSVGHNFGSPSNRIVRLLHNHCF